MDANFTLRAGAAADLAAVMAIERAPGFERWVGRSSAEEHRAMMDDANTAYLVGEAAGETVAFAILRDLNDPHGNCYLKRVAVARPDQGVGGAFLEQVVDWAFDRVAAHRLWLTAFPTTRAPSVFTKSSASPATACCARPISAPTACGAI